MDKTFVFVVCGAKEHIDTLNFSLKALRRYCEVPIVVITDLKRNETEIDHPAGNIIDVQVSTEYDHHQASIYLKTGLHKFLPMDNTLYCYLDTDVVALDKNIESIFSHFHGPITFASDHCRMNQFSSHAVNCGCSLPRELEELLVHFRKEYELLKGNEPVVNRIIDEWLGFKKSFPLEQAKNDWFNPLLKGRPELLEKRTRLISLTDPRLPPHKLAFNYLFRVFPNYRRSLKVKQWKDLDGNLLLDEGPDYHLFMNERGFFYNNTLNAWQNSDGNLATEIPLLFSDFCAERGLKFSTTDQSWYEQDGTLFFPNITKLIEQSSSYWCDPETEIWHDKLSDRIFPSECDHLKNTIRNNFAVDVKKGDWQHWNGGVFLFGKNSFSFLDEWHKLTLAAFSLPNWKTRDQGTLITTVWKLNLQDQPTLPIEYNFIADYYDPEMEYIGDLSFQLNKKDSPVKPHFIHIYHHWGDENWAVWRDVYEHTTRS